MKVYFVESVCYDFELYLLFIYMTSSALGKKKIFH